MFNWLGNLFGGRSAADQRRNNPNLKAVVAQSSSIFASTPLPGLLDKQSAGKLSRDYFLEINSICNAAEPKVAVREKIAFEMLRFALYQVLVISSDSNNDPKGLADMPGLSDQMSTYIDRLVPLNMALRADVHASPLYHDAVDLRELIEVEFWKSYWLLESINAARQFLGDKPEQDDWYLPFMHAACATQENLYRIDLELASAFDKDVELSAPTAYSIFTDIVVSGAVDPLGEWRDYHSGESIPEPGALA